MIINSIAIALAAYRPEPKDFFQQLESIQKQSWTHWICVITLDSSLRELRIDPIFNSFFLDSRFEWHENSERLGHKKNFEHAMQLASKKNVEAVACSDQDDVWYTEKLQICIENLQKQNSLSLVHSDMDFWSGSPFVHGRAQPNSVWAIERRGVQNVKSEDLLVRNVVAGCSMLLDAELVRRFPRIPDGVDYHDHWYALVASYFGGVYAIRQALFAYRQHPRNVVGVTPFPGVFTLPDQVNAKTFLQKCKKNYLKSKVLFQTVKEQGLPVTIKQGWMFQNSLDCSILLLLQGLRVLWKDPALARACIARAFGKFTTYFPSQ